MAKEQYGYKYRFIFPDGRDRTFELRLDDTLKLLLSESADYPDWTRLSCNQCPGCPLRESENPRCPVAVSLIEPIEFFKDALSVEEVDVEIESPTRTYIKRKVLLSHGVSCLFGIYMVTSGCPILGKLKPMVRTHLPFATLKETAYRVIGMYLLGQYFMARRGKAADWDLKGLISLYKEITKVNRSFCDRLHLVCAQDASLNAVVHLNCFADNSAIVLEKIGLQEIEKSFDEFLAGG
ncbi:MAG: hypothetical protein ABIJ96_04855 [Elusimicrobiota bacterium]